ncbi:hypothetical protein CROQUDRAFT_42064 [Cronartium quercuum f. sp. fusiforme G11]|uniref:Mediator of RNA polymerase II transcription subunit 12 n=1 Tax=Cronartium quercuum f. sp. fusiforme G11 TaxID=708437 RepID=A0A9P6NQV7_9BASI|nr:hypothetical protein CROQUDRAFT_42064 [Cronartium quercuum f. sp. fusiforme G11]
MPPNNSCGRMNQLSSSNSDPPRCPTEQELERLGLHPYALEPPEWRLPIQTNQPALGFPGLHPTHAGQQEDAMTKSLVQGGFSARTFVGVRSLLSHLNYPLHKTESFSAHQMIYKKLSDDAGFNISSAGLSALIEARRRYCAISQYDTKSTIKIPGRVTLNDQKRENWLRELADPDVPLLKLSKNVPHGYKGEKLLDMLVQRRIEPARAVWYIRLIGLNEIIAQRNKNDLMHVKYTITFSSEFCQFLQKQLGEVTVPLQLSLTSTTSLITGSSRLAGMNVRSKLRSSTLSDPESRKGWVAKFTHSVQILKKLYAENLIDKPTLFKWFVDQLKLANLAQVHFLLDIHQLVVDKFCLSSNLVRGFVEACLGQIRYINKQNFTPYLSNLELRLRLAIQSSFIICADNFVWPDLWSSNRVILEDILLSCTSTSSSSTEPFQQHISSVEVKEMLRNDFFAVDWRISELVGDIGTGTGPPTNTFTRRARLVEILDGFSDYQDFTKLYQTFFLAPEPGDATTFKDRIEILLSWSTTPFRISDDRIYLTCQMLACVRKDRKIVAEDFQNHFIGWLEQVETTGHGDTLVRLFSELSKRNVFSYGAYIQRMVAKGDMEDDVMAGKSSGLQTLLSEWMPLASTSKLLRSSGAHLRRSPGRDVARNGLLSALADITAALATSDYSKIVDIFTRPLDVYKPTSASRKVVAEVLPDPLCRLVSELSSSMSTRASHAKPRPSIHLASAALSWGICILESCKDYSTLHDVFQHVLQHIFDGMVAHDHSLVLDTFGIHSRFSYLHAVCVAIRNSRRVLEIEARLGSLVSRLFEIYLQLAQSNATSGMDLRLRFARSLRTLVIESRAAGGQVLDVLNRATGETGAVSMTKLLIMKPMLPSPCSSGSLPSITQDMLHLFLHSPSPESISNLFNRYWVVHGSDPLAAPSVWNSLVFVLGTFTQQGLAPNQSSQVARPATSGQSSPDWNNLRSTVLRLCEELAARSQGSLTSCVVRSGSLPPPDGIVSKYQDGVEPVSEEGEECEDSTDANQTSTGPFYIGPTLSPVLRMLYLELISTGALSIEVVLEVSVLKPLDDLPHSVARMMGGSKKELLAYEDVVNRVLGLYDLTRALLVSRSPFEPDEGKPPMDQASPSKMMTLSLADSTQGQQSDSIEMSGELFVKTWILKSERERWLEGSPAGPAFYSRLLLSVLVTTKGLMDISPSASNGTPVREEAGRSAMEEDRSSSPPLKNYLNRLLEILERFRVLLCTELSTMRQVMMYRADLIMDPIIKFIDKNSLGSSFNTKLMQTVETLLPYTQPGKFFSPCFKPDLVYHKYPYLESVFKNACVFTHAARTRQFELYLRLLASGFPPQLDEKSPPPTDLNAVFGALVEVMARKLHLTDSKEASPLFLTHLLPMVAEAVVIKLSAYLGISIFKLFAPSQIDPDYEVSRIHHICRCINMLTDLLMTRTAQPNGDVCVKSSGGTGQLMCNATLESYLSYWNQLKNGLTGFSAKFIQASYVGAGSGGVTDLDARSIRCLLHSIQVLLKALPGLVGQLGQVKGTIAEILVEIAMSSQAHPTLMSQIMDTVGILLFPTIPDDITSTAVVGTMRKRFRWLHIPITEFQDTTSTSILPMTRLKYILGSSLRGVTTSIQERTKDGAVRLLEEKAWEELEKMELGGPGFLSVDGLKCQTLSQTEVAPETKMRRKRKRGSIGDSRTGDGVEEGAKDGEEGEESEWEEELTRGERTNFEHELNTDLLSTLPLHFLRSLYPSKTHLEATCHVHPEPESEGGADGSGESIAPAPTVNVAPTKKRKIGQSELASVAVHQPDIEAEASEHVGPTLRSTRSSRRKSAANVPPPAPAPAPAPPASTRRGKKR